MALTTIVLGLLVVSALVGWFGWPPAEPAPGRVDIGGPCSAATREWAEALRRSPNRTDAVLQVSVLCQANGKTHAATLTYSAAAGVPRFASWRPTTTFFETLPPHKRERVDIFDHTGQLLEYATVERRTGRIEFYDAASRPTGGGVIDLSSGRVERFSAEGHRERSPMLPIPPDVGDAASR